MFNHSENKCFDFVQIIGVDPFGSTISVGGGPENAHSYEVEGIGYGMQI